MAFNVFEYLGDTGNKIQQTANRVGQAEKKINKTLENVWSFVSGEKYGAINRALLKQVLSRPDYMPAWNWDIELPPVQSMGKTFKLSSAYVEATNIPMYQFGTRDVFRGGRNRKYASHLMTLQDLTMTLYADVNNNALGYLIAWMQNIYPGGGYWNLPYNAFGQNSGYMKQINLYARDMYNQNVLSLEYYDCFPISFDTTGFSSDNARIQYTVTFAVNDLKVAGYNMTTFSQQMADLFTGTINNAMNTLADSVLGPIKAQATSIGKSAWNKIKTTDVFQTATSWFS